MSLIVDRELASHVEAWRLNPSPMQVVEEIASYGHETRRIPDSYFYIVDPITGKLIAPATGKPVENYMDTVSYLGTLEYEGFRKTQNWAEMASSGDLSIWFSPPLPGTYNVSKLIITEIEDELQQKKVLNHAVLFDATEQQCIEIVQQLAHQWGIDVTFFDSTDAIRAHPVMLTCSLEECVNLLGQYIKDGGWDSIKTKESLKTKENSLMLANLFFNQYINQSTAEDIYQRNNPPQESQNKLFGEYGGSCPRDTAFNLLFEGARILCCTCPFCQEQVEARIFNGEIHCPKCKRSAQWRNN